MDSRGSRVRWIVGAVAVALTLLLASCSAPPPARKVARPASQVVRNPNTEVERSRRVAEPAPPPKPEVEATETTPPKPESTGTASARGASRRKRLAGYPGEVAHTASETKIALTFDCGASAAPTPGILATLSDAGLRVTFFLTGRWAEQNPELVKQIAAAGHEIGNHSYSHKDFRKLSDEAIIEQLRRTEDIVRGLTGRSTKPLFRPPYGGRDKRVLSIVGEEGYRSIYWSLDSWDAFKKGITGAEIEKRVLDRIQGGDIVLLHCGSAATAAILPDLIEKLQKRGYEIVKVSDLLPGE